MKTIKVICAGDGTARLPNPYDRNADLEDNERWKDFAKANPPLPIFKIGEPYLIKGEVECEIDWQFKDYGDSEKWMFAEDIQSDRRFTGTMKRQIYLVVTKPELVGNSDEVETAKEILVETDLAEQINSEWNKYFPNEPQHMDSRFQCFKRGFRSGRESQQLKDKLKQIEQYTSCGDPLTDIALIKGIATDIIKSL
jgi:hypothetical protein